MDAVCSQSSLHQFLGLFSTSLRDSDPSPQPKARVFSIIAHAARSVLSWACTGLYGDHKLLLKLLYLIKLCGQFGLVPSDLTLTLAAPGANGSPSLSRTKPFAWLPPDVSATASRL